MKRKILFSVITAFCMVFFISAKGSDNSQSNNGWKAGIARTVITPEQSLWMAGYGSRDHESEGTLHDLWAKALVLQDADGNKGVLVTTDILGYTKEMADKIRDAAKEKYGLAKSQIILNASHTHSGPALKDQLPDAYPIGEKEKAKEPLRLIGQRTFLI